MRRSWIGPALALGLQCAMPSSAGAEQPAAEPDAAPLRFVADPRLVRDVDPADNLRPVVTVLTPGAATSAAPAKNAASASWPTTLHEVHAERVAKGKPEQWSPAEVQDARARCAKILKSINAVAEIQEPIRVGSCGTPAPITLTSIGKKPAVTFSPAATVTCEMAEALHKWIVTGLQPLARQHLGAPIIKIEKMSDYSCRNAYGRARGRLSEHGRANALDIAGFQTANGGSAMLLADWGLTERDVRQQIAAAKKEAEKADAQRLAAARAAQENARDSRHQRPSGAPSLRPPAGVAIATGAPAGAIARPTILDGVDGGDSSREAITFSMSGGNGEAQGETPIRTPLDGMIGRLGGAVPRAAVATGSIVHLTAGGVAINGDTSTGDIGKARFLRGAHETACKIFGTVLGPEANNAHRNHLHVDLAQRGVTGAFCE